LLTPVLGQIPTDFGFLVPFVFNLGANARQTDEHTDMGMTSNVAC